MQTNGTKCRTVLVAGVGKVVYSLTSGRDGYALTVSSPAKAVTLPSLTRSRKNALWVLDLFADGSVLPENAEEIADDLIGITLL